MIININLNNYHPKREFADTLTKEQRMDARRTMARQLGELLETPTSESLYWIESKVDLMELVHEVYMSEMLEDSKGHPLQFRKMVRRACAVLHVPEPANCYSMVHNAQNRKRVKQTSFFSRYCHLLYRKKEGNPLKGMIMKMKNEE